MGRLPEGVCPSGAIRSRQERVSEHALHARPWRPDKQKMVNTDRTDTMNFFTGQIVPASNS